MGILFFIMGIFMVTVSGIFAFKNRHNTSKCIASISLGILFSTFFMILPTEWVKDGKVVESPTLYAILSALFYSFKAVGGRQEIAQMETIRLEGILKTVYIYVNYLMFALAPIFASGLVLTFIGDTGEKIRYFFSWSPKCHVFSEVNEKSVALATGIKESPGRKTLVFCDTKTADKALLVEAKKLGAITLYKSCKNLQLFRRFKKYEFYFISENEDNNIELTEDMIDKKNRLEKHKIVVNSFVQGGVNIDVMESMVSKKACAVFESTCQVLREKAMEIVQQSPRTILIFFNASKSDQEFEAFSATYSVNTYSTPWDVTEVDESFKSYDMTLYYTEQRADEGGKNIIKVSNTGIGYRKNRLVIEWQDEPLEIRFVDEISLLCYDLVFKYPLHNLPNNRTDICVLLVGCGRMGMQMLKTVSWCGQIAGHTLKMRVLDKKAKSIEREFYFHYPEMNHYDIQFEEVDVESIEFENKVKSYSDVTYVCVATGLDELNLSTANHIYQVLRRNYDGYIPPIFTRVRKTVKVSNFEAKGSFLEERNIHLFGTTASRFSNNVLFNSQLEKLALAVHLCYNGVLDEPENSFCYRKVLSDFYVSEYARRSSMSAALHIMAKLRAKSWPTEAELNDFEKVITDKTAKEILVKNEHERWNAFMRSEGFRTVDFATVRKYAPYTRSHKDEMARLHPCIVSWDDLDSLQKQYDELQRALNLKQSNFKEYDQKIVEEIPKIIRKANQLYKEG